ncbi:MAG: glycosyltransferase [Candidatus Omnitrophica bacterium]|nr:glycosyltransferase [Candidatus Omnitrophota bacterium]
MTIIFLVDIFPSISETFILNQVTGMIDLGHEVFIFSASRSDEPNFHDDVRKYDLLKRTYFHNDIPSSKWKRFLWALFMVFSYGHRNPRAILNALNFFKYGKEALSLTYLYKVMLFLGVNKADVLYGHFGHNGNFAALMKELGIAGKVVTMFHGYDIRRGIKNKDLYKPLFKYADAILSISDYNYQHLVEFGAPVERIYNHPVGIHVGRYVSLPLKTPEQGEVIRILSVGRLVEEKGFGYAIDVIHQLVYERGLTHIEYCIIGDGPLREELQAKVKSLKLTDKVFFLGYQPQDGVEQSLACAHLFLLSSVAEALPVVLMEAQASGLPVVATRVGSVHQLVMDGVSGFIVAPEDVHGMCDKLEYLIRHPFQWKAMGQEGRRSIQEHYDVKALNLKLDKIFKEIILK